MVLLPEMGASCVEEPPIWISGVIALEDKEAGLVFGAISTEKLVLKTKKIKIFNLFLTLDTKLSEEEEESNDDSWKTVVFIGTVIRRDTRCMSQDLILARRIACVLNEREFCALKRRRPLNFAGHVAARPEHSTRV